MTVRRYMVWDDTAGTAAARPFVRLIICDHTLIADQPLDAGQAYDFAPDSFTPEEDGNTGDSLSVTYTVNTTVSPKTVSASSTSRFALAEREDFARRKIDRLLSEAAEYALPLDRAMTDGQMTSIIAYTNALRDLLTDPGFPDSLSFPTKPSFVGADFFPLWTRLYRRGNALGTVNKVGGFPVGALFETEVVSSGAYEKSAGGWLKCSHRAAATFNTSGSLIYTWTFPHEYGSSFPARRTVKVELSNRDNSNTIPAAQLSNARMGDLHVIVNTQGSANNVQILLRDRTNSLVSGDICWIEISSDGRWD